MKTLFLIFLFPLSVFGLAQNLIEPGNSTTTPLAAGATWTGATIVCSPWNDFIGSVKTDQAGELYIDQSPDGTNWDSTLSFEVSAATNEVHKIAITKKYCRARFTNTSESAQTYLRLQTMLGESGILSSPLNSVSGQDADAIVTKSFPAEQLMAEGKITGYAIVNKYGINPSIDTASVPEDVWGGDGLYTGFPAAAENLEVVSTSADDSSSGTGARTVRATCLDANYNQVLVTVTLNGLTPVTTSTPVLRCHTAQTLTAGSGGLNAGNIIFRQATTEANIFLTMIAARNQTNNSCYTVPAGKTAYIKQVNATILGGATASVNGQLWVRAFNSVFRSRRPFSAGSSFAYRDQIYGGVVLTEKSDICVRITLSSANNVQVASGYDLILVDN